MIQDRDSELVRLVGEIVGDAGASEVHQTHRHRRQHCIVALERSGLGVTARRRGSWSGSLGCTLDAGRRGALLPLAQYEVIEICPRGRNEVEDRRKAAILLGDAKRWIFQRGGK